MRYISPKTYGYTSTPKAKGIVIETENGISVVQRPTGVYLSANGQKVTVRGNETSSFNSGNIFRIVVHHYDGTMYSGDIVGFFISY